MPKHRGDLVSPNVLGQYRAEIPSQPEIKQEATARNIGSTTTKSSCTTFVSGCSLRIHFQWIENDYLHATIHCVSCSFFCSKRDWLHFFFRTDCRSLLSVSVFLCFQERYSVWRNRRIEQGSMLHHLSFCCLSGKLCLRKNPHLL